MYCIPLGGVRVRQPWAIGGSGSTYIYAYCDATYKAGMNEQDAMKWIINCTYTRTVLEGKTAKKTYEKNSWFLGLALAMARDGSSGGVIRTAVITKDGVRRNMVPGDQLPRFLPEL